MLTGRCALITGSIDGIGFAAAKRLAAEGCHIVLGGFADAARIAERRGQLESRFGVRTRHHGADLREPGEIAAMMAAAAATFGAVDILVNNAVVRHFAPIDTFPVERWDEALAVNLSAAFHLIRLALPGMRDRNFGRIVNMSSVYGTFATENRVDYVTTKTALIGLTRAVALETVRHDITCNASARDWCARRRSRAASGLRPFGTEYPRLRPPRASSRSASRPAVSSMRRTLRR